MKTKILLAILFAFTLPIISYSQITKAEIVATGLTCSMCSNAINKQLKALPQVENVATNLDTNTFTVTLKKKNNITPQQLKQSVEKAGFFVGSMIITLSLDNPKLDNQDSLNHGESTYVFLGAETKQVTDLDIGYDGNLAGLVVYGRIKSVTPRSRLYLDDAVR